MPTLMKDARMKLWVLLTLLYATTSISGELISRDMYCDDTKTITQELRDKYKEIPVVAGKADDVAGSLMSLWTNPLNDTWTIVATKDDYSCIVGAGDKLKVIDYKRKKSV